MWNTKLLVFISLCISALSPSPCTAASGGGKPLLTAVTKDASTSLYTAPLMDGQPLVLDLTSPVASLTTCASKNGTLAKLSATATDGKNPAVSFSAVASCTPSKLPAVAVGVAGLAPSSQSFPAQVARAQKVANKIALCLPSDGMSTSDNSVGVAIFGGAPSHHCLDIDHHPVPEMAGAAQLYEKFIFIAGIAVGQSVMYWAGKWAVKLGWWMGSQVLSSGQERGNKRDQAAPVTTWNKNPNSNPSSSTFV